jgi:hypothetical protein
MTNSWEKQPWIERYQLALIETNLATMPVRIETATSAIGMRLDELRNSVAGTPELLALDGAVRFLRCLIAEAHC